MRAMDHHARQLRERGFTWIRNRFEQPEHAFDVAAGLIDAVAETRGMIPMSVVGDFVVPPLDGGSTRGFQTLHFDFGLPLEPKVEQDIAHFTALHIPVSVRPPTAVTRIVPLSALLTQRAWPPEPRLTERLAAYGKSHGAWDDSRGYVEGSLARVVEAAAGDVPVLPSVKAEPGFLCGMEFDSLTSEVTFFARHGLRLADVAVEIPLGSGQLLIFDNAAVAHGRRGARERGELRQRAYGHKRMDVVSQRRVRDQVLAAFHPSTVDVDAI
jgi:hypothetical protein